MSTNYQAIDWAAIEAVLVAWVAEVTGLEPDRAIIFEQQDATQPPYPYVSLLRQPGAEAVEGMASTVAKVMPDDSLKITTEGPRLFKVSVHAHTERAANPNEDAVALLMNLQASLEVQSILDLFDAVDVAIVDDSGPFDSSMVVNGQWMSRANLDVTFRVTAQIVETQAGYFDKVEIASTVSSELGPFDITVDGSEI